MSYLKEKFTVGNSTVYMFDSQIYPRTLWISITKDTLSDRFDQISEWDESCDALVDSAYDKIDKLGGFIIRFESLDAIDISNIIHESNHVVFEIFSYCGCKLDFDNQEPFCYLAGWVAKCCEEVLKLERND